MPVKENRLFSGSSLLLRTARKGPVQNGRSFGVDVFPVRAQNDQPVNGIPLLGGGHIAAPRFCGKPGFHSVNVGTVSAVFRVQHLVGGADTARRVQVGGRDLVLQGIGDLPVYLVLGTGYCDLSHILCGGNTIIFIRDVSAAKLSRKLEITKYFPLFRYISSEIKQN